MKRIARQSLIMLAVFGGACSDHGNRHVPKGPVGSPEIRGKADATSAIHRGDLRLKCGPDTKHPDWHAEYRKLLRERLGVEFDSVGEQVDGKDVVRTARTWNAYADAWNDMMIAEIRNRFGATVIEELQKEAQTRLDNKN